MKTSCITPPPNDPLVIVRESFVKICNGDVCAAALLNHLIYWHNVKLDQRNQAIAANEIAERHGERGNHVTSLTQWHTEADLKKAMLGAWGKDKIRNGLQILQENGFIDIFRNPNSRFAFDKTRHFIVIPDAIQSALNQSNDTTQPKTESAYGGTQSDDGKQKTDAQLYIEITSKKSSSGKEAVDDDEEKVDAVERMPADPFYTGQARQIAREIVKTQRQFQTPRNFITDAPWGRLAEEIGKDATGVWEKFKAYLEQKYSDKQNPENYCSVIASKLWENPGSELNSKDWIEFADYFRKNLTAPPAPKKSEPRPVEIVEIPDREASREAFRRLKG